MRHAVRSSGGATSRPRSSPGTAAGSSKIVLHPRFQVAIDKAANRAGMRAYNDYIEEWHKTQRPCGDDLEAEVAAEAERLEAEYTKHHLAELIQSGGVAGGPALPPADHIGDLRDMTDTVLCSATREVVIGFDRPFVHHRRADQPDRPQAAGRGDEGRRLQPRRARRDRPGRGRRPHARRQRGHPAGRRAGDPRQDHPARPEPDRPAAVDRLVDRRGARGRPRRLPGQAAASTRSPARRSASSASCRSSRSTARRSWRSATTTPASAMDPDVRFAVAKRIVERAADHGIPRADIVVDPLVMPIGAMRTAGRQVFALVRPAARRAQGQLDLRRVERQLRAAEPRGHQRRVPADGDRGRDDLGDHQPDACRTSSARVMAADVLMGNDPDCAPLDHRRTASPSPEGEVSRRRVNRRAVAGG